MSKEAVLKNVKEALNKNPLRSDTGVYTDIIKPVEKDIISEYKRGQEANKALFAHPKVPPKEGFGYMSTADMAAECLMSMSRSSR